MDIGTEPQTSIASTTTTSAQCNAMQLCTVIYGTRPPTILECKPLRDTPRGRTATVPGQVEGPRKI